MWSAVDRSAFLKLSVNASFYLPQEIAIVMSMDKLLILYALCVLIVLQLNAEGYVRSNIII